VSELDQARFLVRGTVLALSQLAESVCWYTLLDYPGFLSNKEDAFGLFRYQVDPVAGALDPKPAYQAARTLAAVLGQTRFVKDLDVQLRLPNDAFGFFFRNAKTSQAVVVFWATRDDVAISTGLSTGFKRVRRVDMDGTTTELGKLDRVDLTLGPTPIYLVLDAR
jgi:hypothetical protein